MATYEIIVVANADQAEAAMSSLAGKIGLAGAAADAHSPKVVNLTERLAAMGPAGKTGSVALNDVANMLTGRLGIASAGASEVVSSLNAKLGGLSGAGLAAAGGAAAYAAAALVTYEVVKKSVTAFTEYADQIRGVALTTGMSAQQASVLNAAAGMLGISADTLTRSFGTLNQQLDKGTFAKYGIEVAKNADGTVNFNETLKNLAQHLATDSSATQANAEAKTLLGRSYRDLMPLLAQGADGFQRIEDIATKHAAILTPEDLSNAENLKVQMGALHDEIQKVWIEIGSKLVPGLVDMAAGLVRVVTDIDSFIQRNQWLVTGLKGLAGVLSMGVVPALEMLGNSSTNAAALQEHVAKQALDAAQAYHMAAEAADAYTNAMNAGATEADSFASADIAAQQAKLSLAQEQAAWSDKVAKAEQQRAQAIAQANRDIASSTQALRDAEIKSAEDIASAKHQILTAQQQLRADSQVDLQSARTVADAQTRLERVKADIASGKISGVDAIRQEQDAELALARAQQDQGIAASKQAQKIQDDKYNVAQAQQHLSDVERTSTEAITAAKQRQADAEAALTKAQDTTAISAADLAQRNLALESATLRVYDANLKLQGEINKIKSGLADGTINAIGLEGAFKRMGLDSIPTFRSELAKLLPLLDHYVASAQAAALANTLHINPVPTSFASSSATSSTSTESVNVSINAPGVIFDPTSANAVGEIVANGVIKEIRRRYNSGENVFPVR